jgi:hypothetical protein
MRFAPLLPPADEEATRIPIRTARRTVVIPWFVTGPRPRWLPFLAQRGARTLVRAAVAERGREDGSTGIVLLLAWSYSSNE